MSKSKRARSQMAGSKTMGNVRSAREKKDDSVMNTNDSSIVSKRSVSKLYFTEEPDFYAPFVSKFVRRNPLINRGYWLRMHAIEQVVKQFLEENSEKTKVIVNLGCGYDPLPFQFWHRHASISQSAVFVDVDYPQLIGRKTDRIMTHSLLRDALLRTNLRLSKAPVHARSDNYIALGCDLRDLETLERVLEAEFDLTRSSLLFVAEVSLTYMPVTDSDSLIHWASTLNDARFCLLEQYLPEGPEHPFAHTMLGHFDKLHTSIQAVKKYVSLDQQASRFTHAGWPMVEIARNLWDLWSDEAFTPPVTRRGMDAVEPFDEWEEFAIFAGHYFLLVASKADNLGPMKTNPEHRSRVPPLRTDETDACSIFMTHYTAPSDSLWTPRRLGAAFALGQNTVAFHGGQGVQSRLTSLHVLRREDPVTANQPCDSTPPRARICHTVTSLDVSSALLVGGRASPAQALADCWLLRHGVWEQVHSLSPARFRHVSVKVTIPCHGSTAEGVVVSGGKTSDGTVLGDWNLWTPTQGWAEIFVDGLRPSPRFGAAISTMGSAQNWGFLVGGMAPSGTVLEELWEWRMTAAPHPRLNFKDRTNDIQKYNAEVAYGRIGASLIPLGGILLLIGGVSKKGVHGLSEDFLAIAQESGTIHIRNPNLVLPESTWPLLVGAGVAAVSQDEVVIAGGGAVCFSMGSFWNEGYFTITAGDTAQPSWTVPVSQSATTAGKERLELPLRINGKVKAKRPAGPTPTRIPRIQLQSFDDFAEVLSASKPTIIEGLDVGPCCELWTLDYLKNKVGAEKEIVVHDCESERMTFQDKNFRYVKKPFGEFIDSIAQGSRAYLRAISSSQPNKLPTKLEDDFPDIAADFQLPEILGAVKTNYHSSPLRISGPVSLWLHYDVLANVLCQIRGSKTLHLYPPSDGKYLSFPPGGSSSDIDVLASKDFRLRNTHPHIASLEPGDILFIPPMWSHTATPEEGVSVAVNVFFKNLGSGYAAGKDVYGNRDLQAYENGRRDVERIVKAFKNVPDDVAKFYLDRLVGELEDKSKGIGRMGR